MTHLFIARSGPLSARRWRAFTLLVFLTAIIFGCGRSELPSERGADHLQRVRLQLNWLPDAQFGGYYAALLAGDYVKEGLDVEIVVGGPDAAVLPKLAMRRVEFGIGNADQLLLARQEGADVVAVLAVMQDNPRCIMVHASARIDQLSQLNNVTLAMGEGNAFAQYLKDRLPLDGVRIVSYAGSVAKFLVDDRFAQQAYVFSEPIVARNRGSDPQTLMVSQLGFNPYAGIVMVHRDLHEQQPALVRSFVRATQRGWSRYLDSPAAANREIHRVNPEADLESLATAVELIRPLCWRKGAISRSDFGTMSHERWETLAHQLSQLDLMDASQLDIDEVFVVDYLKSEPTAPVSD